MATHIEIDFLPVGAESKSGDAIAIRYGTADDWKVMVVDGGDAAGGQTLVDHLTSNYGHHVQIEHAVCTHFDGDHASGLRMILDSLPVANLWLHQPWNHVAELNPSFKHNWTDEGLANRLRHETWPIIAEIVDLAEAKGIPLLEPFAGLSVGPFTVLAPTKDRYLELVPKMSQTPVERAMDSAPTFAQMFKSAAAAVLGTFEGWGVESLQNPSENSTSAPNESSVVLFAELDDGHRILLTGDAGVGALFEAVWAAGQLGLNIQSPNWIQMPHHGSRHNVGPDILDAVLGSRLDQNDQRRGGAVASVAVNCPKRPYRSVQNAFHRRGYPSNSTKGKVLNWVHGWNLRPGFSPLAADPFHDFVED